MHRIEQETQQQQTDDVQTLSYSNFQNGLLLVSACAKCQYLADKPSKPLVRTMLEASERSTQ